MNLDSAIDSLLSPIADRISGIIFYSVTINGVEVQLLVALLMFAALYFTFRMRFIGIWGFKHGLKLILNKYKHDDLIKANGLYAKLYDLQNKVVGGLTNV